MPIPFVGARQHLQLELGCPSMAAGYPRGKAECQEPFPSCFANEVRISLAGLKGHGSGGKFAIGHLWSRVPLAGCCQCRGSELALPAFIVRAGFRFEMVQTCRQPKPDGKPSRLGKSEFGGVEAQ